MKRFVVNVKNAPVVIVVNAIKNATAAVKKKNKGKQMPVETGLKPSDTILEQIKEPETEREKIAALEKRVALLEEVINHLENQGTLPLGFLEDLKSRK